MYEKKLKYSKALQNYRMSLKFDPENEPIANLIHHVVFMIEKRRRQEHLDPQMMPPTEKEMMDSSIKMSGPGAVLFESLLPHLLNLKDDPRMICEEADKHFHGHGGYKKDLEQAAVLFSKAAEKGDALGMYRLGLMMLEGNGVDVDVVQSFKLRKRAAEMGPIMEIFPGWGKKP